MYYITLYIMGVNKGLLTCFFYISRLSPAFHYSQFTFYLVNFLISVRTNILLETMRLRMPRREKNVYQFLQLFLPDISEKKNTFYLHK